MSAAPGRSQASSHRSPQGGGCLVSAAGPFPRRSFRSPQGGGCLVSAAGSFPRANSAMRNMEDAL